MRRRTQFAAFALLAAIPVAIALGCGGGGGETPSGDVPGGLAEDVRGPDRRSTPDVRDGRPVVVAFGDSLTSGYGAEVEEAWPARLQESLDSLDGGSHPPLRVVNAGVSGETTAGGLRRLPWVLDREPDAAIVVIALGGNDGLRGVPVWSMTENLRGMVGEATGRGLGVLLAGVSPPPALGPDYEEEFRSAFGEVAAEAGVALLPDILEGVAGVPELNQPDRIHPNPEGARRLAANVLAALELVLAERFGDDSRKTDRNTPDA